jgi:NAD(P)-dependent dehydrogenase (short-subunit alcohol dehydrogenase family)
MVGRERGKAFLDARHPIGHMAEPRELGEVVLFLASERASFVTGAEIVADGGMTTGLMRRPPLAAS